MTHDLEMSQGHTHTFNNRGKKTKPLQKVIIYEENISHKPCNRYTHRITSHIRKKIKKKYEVHMLRPFLLNHINIFHI